MTVELAPHRDAPPLRAEPVLELRGLSVEYATRNRTTRAVDGISLAIAPGEILGLAGESGCGKSTVANAVMQILRPPARIVGGEILFDGENLAGRSREELRKYRWRSVSMVFQSAMNSLNPVARVGDQFVDMMRAHERLSKHDALVRAGELLELVGIDARRVRAYPHELSGGMRQRVIIAMALALEPELVIMDEPTTALDVVVQREILQQVRDLQAELGFAVLFITHDLSLLLEMADKVAVMYAGRIVETATSRELRRQPRHPYSYGLLNSFPTIHGPRRRMTGIPGSPPDLRAIPSGCAFHPRCPCAFAACPTVLPRLLPSTAETPEQMVACHLYDPRLNGGERPPNNAEFAAKYEEKYEAMQQARKA